MRPSRPVPWTRAISMPVSATSRRTAGESGAPRPSLFDRLAVSPAAGSAGFTGWVGLGSSAAALGTATPAPWPDSMIASFVPTLTVSPAATSILSRVPATSDGTSVATLSVSISTNNSSIATLSPSFLCQAATVPSSTVSPNCGMMTSIAFPPTSRPQCIFSPGIQAFPRGRLRGRHPIA